MLTAKIENDELVIRISVNPRPVPSKTGKTLVVASSNGNVPTSLIIDGKPLMVGVNAYIDPR